MKIKGILVSGATIAAAAALTFGGLALANPGDQPEPVAATTASPSPVVTPEPTITETPAPTPTETAAPAPAPTVAPAPAPAPKQAAPVLKDPPPAPAPTTAIQRNWPKFVPVVPQPADSPMPAGYQVTADGTWFLGCGEGDTSCSWTAGPAVKP